MRIAMINAKGGTAKTTSAINIAHAMAMQKKKVLICDLDPQASASVSLGFRKEALLPSFAEVLIEKHPVEQAIRKTGVEGVSLLTASIGLSSFDIHFAQKAGREYRVKNALASIQGFDVILFDCPPTLGLLSLNALTASNYFIVPVTPQYLALEGLSILMEAIERIREGIICETKLIGILLTQVDRRGKSTHEIVKLIRDHYGDLVFKHEVRINIRLTEAPSFGRTIFQYDRSASGAKAYYEVASEILKKLKKGKNE